MEWPFSLQPPSQSITDTQWPVKAAAFSDLPMTRPPSEHTYYELFKAKYTTQYLENYIDHHRYAGVQKREVFLLLGRLTFALWPLAFGNVLHV